MSNRNFAVELAASIPFESHLEALKEAIEEYLENPTDDLKHSVMMGAMLLSMKGITDDKSTEQVIEDLDNIERATNFFKLPKN